MAERFNGRLAQVLGRRGTHSALLSKKVRNHPGPDKYATGTQLTLLRRSAGRPATVYRVRNRSTAFIRRLLSIVPLRTGLGARKATCYAFTMGLTALNNREDQ